MLTATYTLVALSVEQASIRLSVLSFQKYVASTLTRQQSLTLSQLEYACVTLERLYHACNWRKIELYLIPALRQATERADGLLEELSRLNQFALGVVRRLKAQAEGFGPRSDEQVKAICDAIDSFCGALLQRLEKEEQELFAIARSAICGEAWFAIANKLLAHDAQMAEARRSGGEGVEGDAISIVPRLAPPAGAVVALDIRLADIRPRPRERSAGPVPQRAAAAD